MLKVKVAYATPKKQQIVELNVAENLRILEVIIQSKITNIFPEIAPMLNSETLSVGIYGKKIDINTYTLQDNDRIEIYRSLAKTPNERRQERAKLMAKA